MTADIATMDWRRKLLVGAVALYEEQVGWSLPEELVLRSRYEDMILNASDEDCGRAAVEFMHLTDPHFRDRVMGSQS